MPKAQFVGMRVIALGVVFCTAIRAFGAPLFPGGTIPTPPEPDPTGGVVVGGGVPVAFASPPGPGGFSGTLTTTVISGDPSNPLGGLTFTYRLTNSPTSLTSIERMTDLDFSGFLTDVSYQPGPGFPPSSTDRSVAPGVVVGWTFGGVSPAVAGAPAGPGIPPGGSSTLLVVQTNATAFDTNTAFLIDGSIASVATLSPTSVVPEPTSLMLLSAGALALLRRRG